MVNPFNFTLVLWCQGPCSDKGYEIKATMKDNVGLQDLDFKIDINAGYAYTMVMSEKD